MSNSFHLPVDRSEAWEFAVNVHVGVCLQVDRECGLQPIDSYFPRLHPNCQVIHLKCCT